MAQVLICRECKQDHGGDKTKFMKDGRLKSGHKNYCVDCNKNRAMKIADENRLIINGFKNRPCMDCGKSYPPYIMDCDHRGDKLFDISAGYLRGKQSLIKELNKCDVVCANCHRERTEKRRNEPI